MTKKRIRTSRREYHRKWKAENRDKVRAYANSHRPSPAILGLDGEGLTRDGEHTYNYLAICEGEDPVSSAEDMWCLSTVSCLETIIRAKQAKPHSIIVGFSLGYDYSLILRDLPNDKLFKLYRPEHPKRRGPKGRIKPVRWNGYLLNLLRNRLTVTKLIPGKHRKGCERDTCRGCEKGTTATVWDIFGFYQGAFIDACKKWGVITDAEYAFLKQMKDDRPTFRQEDWETIKRYCHLECGKLGDLFRRLREAHEDVGLPLQSYFGAGSTASVLLRRMGIRSYLPTDTPIEVERAASFAFFGGRFECSRVGPYTKKVYSYDIASAYPYHAYLLPCLACGRWRHIKKNIDSIVAASRFALVRYSVHGRRDNTLSVSPEHWGALPFRCSGIAGVGPSDSIIDDGSIVYPASSGGGWTYKDEYLVAASDWKVKAHEAWIYETECDHHPFKELADMYIERLRLGKEAAGIVLKLGINSCYGKVAQSIGKPLYRCPLWAGAITSGCRAQLLSLIAQDPAAILSVATDGIVSKHELVTPLPEDTTTHERAKAFGKVGLGGWEKKEVSGGVHLVRPGIAFALNNGMSIQDTPVELEQTRARGVGRSTLNRHKQLIIDSWAEHGPKPVELEHTIFRGAKSSISHSKRGYNRSEQYGQWVKRITVLSYDPEPKRPFHTQDDGRLSTWAFSQNRFSAAYDHMAIPGDVQAMIADKLIAGEQPDGGTYEDYL